MDLQLSIQYIKKIIFIKKNYKNLNDWLKINCVIISNNEINSHKNMFLIIVVKYNFKVQDSSTTRSAL